MTTPPSARGRTPSLRCDRRYRSPPHARPACSAPRPRRRCPRAATRARCAGRAPRPGGRASTTSAPAATWRTRSRLTAMTPMRTARSPRRRRAITAMSPPSRSTTTSATTRCATLIVAACPDGQREPAAAQRPAVAAGARARLDDERTAQRDEVGRHDGDDHRSFHRCAAAPTRGSALPRGVPTVHATTAT